jgi:hypothetical protein
LIAFGTAGLLAVAGIVVAVLTSGTGAQIAAIVLLSVGFGGAVLLVFLEVGLSEDRARAREEAERRRRQEAETRGGQEAERRGGQRPPWRAQRSRGRRWPRRPT